jgi:hypothetical protein
MLQNLFSRNELQLMNAAYIDHGTDGEHILFDQYYKIFVVQPGLYDHRRSLDEWYVAVPGLYEELEYVLPVDINDPNDVRVKIIEVMRMLKAGELA